MNCIVNGFSSPAVHEFVEHSIKHYDTAKNGCPERKIISHPCGLIRFFRKTCENCFSIPSYGWLPLSHAVYLCSKHVQASIGPLTHCANMYQTSILILLPTVILIVVSIVLCQSFHLPVPVSHGEACLTHCVKCVHRNSSPNNLRPVQKFQFCIQPVHGLSFPEATC
ncbi:hypothetical protein E4T56_gene15931 [Termitomyces sp. T112]|nr:hypothetical protein E4T56_gene15931 [Termitomyces sp. T112]